MKLSTMISTCWVSICLWYNLCSCGMSCTPEQTTQQRYLFEENIQDFSLVQASSEQTFATQATVQSTDQNVTIVESEVIDVFFDPKEYLRLTNMITVRWGESIEESRYEFYFGTIKDENGNEKILTTGLTCVKVDVLQVWNQADRIKMSGVLHSFSEMTYLWVDDLTLAGIHKGDTAIVFPYLHDVSIRREFDFTPYGPYLYMDGFQDYSVLFHHKTGDYPCANVFPIIDGRLQITKTDEQTWSKQIETFYAYNDLLDEERSTIPRFVNGMTLEEFEQLVASLID